MQRYAENHEIGLGGVIDVTGPDPMHFAVCISSNPGTRLIRCIYYTMLRYITHSQNKLIPKAPDLHTGFSISIY
jgi:hypothetical protein